MKLNIFLTSYIIMVKKYNRKGGGYTVDVTTPQTMTPTVV